MLDERDWINQTVAVDDFTVDVGFLIRKDFYYGDPNDRVEIESGRSRTSIHRPALTTPGNVVLVSALEGSINDLVHYYKDVLTIVRKRHRQIKQCLHYFWIRPYIIYKDDAVCCPWYDRYYEVERFLSAFLSIEGDGDVYWDADDGWELNVIAKGDRVYIREAGYEERVLIHCRREEVRRQSRDMLAKTSAIVDQLKIDLGDDYWSMKNY